jgi:aminotransferase EvaB
MLGAGAGGIVSTNEDALVERVRRARDYGDQLPDARHLNDQLTDIEAAVALEQLRKLPEILRLREERARAYTQALAPLADRELLVLPADDPGRIWYRYAVRLKTTTAPEIARRTAAVGVCSEQPVWDLRASDAWTGDLPNTGAAFDRVLSLPLYPDLTDAEQDLVCDALAGALGAR